MKNFVGLVMLIITGQAIGGEYHNVNGTNYWISYPLKANYHQAGRHCAINGNYLVSIHTQDNHNTVMEALWRWNSSYPGDAPFWTSGTNLGHPDKEFYWAETGYPITFSNWIAGYPNGDINRKCIVFAGTSIYKYQWVNHNCNDRYHFICVDKIILPNLKVTGCLDHFN